MNHAKRLFFALLGISLLGNLGCSQGSSKASAGGQNSLETSQLGEYSSIGYHRFMEAIHVQINLESGVARVGEEPNATDCAPSLALLNLLATAKTEIQISKLPPTDELIMCPQILFTEYDYVKEASGESHILGDFCGSQRDYKDLISRDRSHELFEAYRAHCVPVAPPLGAI